MLAIVLTVLPPTNGVMPWKLWSKRGRERSEGRRGERDGRRGVEKEREREREDRGTESKQESE